MTEPGIVQLDPRPRQPRKQSKAVSQDNRIHNLGLILRTLYHDGPMSRSDLARASELTRPTVSTLVTELLTDGLVADIGPRAESRVGKPATLIELHRTGACVVAVDLSRSRAILGAVVNLRGDVIARVEQAFPAEMGRSAVAALRAVIEELISIAPGKVWGIGVASPGIINDEGLVRYATHLKWTDMPLAKILRDEFDVPVYVGNDINVAAIGAMRYREPAVRDLMIISIDNSVGMGIVVGGKVLEGENFAAGEVGHVTVDDQGAPCGCGRHGCLEAYIGSARRAAHSREVSEQALRQALASAGRAIGIVIAPIVTALNLSHVFISGGTDLVTEPLVQAVIHTTSARTMPIINAPVTITALTDDADLLLQGAAGRVLERQLAIF